MAWVAQKELDDATAAMEKLAGTLMSHHEGKHKISHPAQKLNRREWENKLCNLLGLTSDTMDVVMPENTILIQQNLSRSI